jgi:hypothetical protein
MTSGQAVAHMTIQALALGLAARQFRAFSRAGMAADFIVPEHWEVTTLTAFGGAASAPTPAPELANAPGRQRREVNDIVWPVS